MFVVSHTFPMLWELDGFLLHTKNVRDPQFEMFVLSQTFLLPWEFTFPIFWELDGFPLNPKYLRNPCLLFCNTFSVFFFFFQLLYLESGFLFVAYLTVANLARLGISVHCQVSVRSQYLVRLLSQCWITGGHTVHPPIEGLLPPTGIESTTFRKSAFIVAGLQGHATTPGALWEFTFPMTCELCKVLFYTKYLKNPEILNVLCFLILFTYYGNPFFSMFWELHGVLLQEKKKKPLTLKCLCLLKCFPYYGNSLFPYFGNCMH